jgi:cytochrome c peroxidase
MLEGDTEQAKTFLTPDEEAGLKLFISEQAQCIRCHNGPLFTSNSFHNIGVMTASGLALDYGRLQGAQEVLENEFNCLGDYSDAEPDQCVELRFIKTSGVELPGAFKVPTLRNVAETAPYMQSGQILTLAEVLQHYNKAEPGPLGHNELNPLNLSETQLKQLEAFLGSLTSPVAVDPMRLNPPEEAD